MFKLSPDVDKNKIFLVNLSEIEGRLDPHFYAPRFQKLISKFSKISHNNLGSLVLFSNETWNQEDFFNDQFPYIEISEIDITSGEIRKIKYIPKTKAPSRAKKIVRKNDIIISTTRPHRGAITLISEKHNFHIASTGFSVIRDIKNEDIALSYLYFILRQDFILLQTEQRSSGGNYPAITEDELKKVLIPLPPKETQQEIIDLYESAYKEKQQKEAEAKRLLNSIDDYMLSELGITLPKKDNSLENRIFKVNFSEISGNRCDPYYYQLHFHIFFKQLSKCIYPIFTIKQIAKVITSGITPLSGSDAYTKDKKNGIPFIRSGNININGDINFNELLYIKEEIHKTIMRSSQVKYNDLLIAIVGATIGQVGIYKNNREANINQAIALVRLKGDNNVEFIKEVLNSSIGQYNLSRLKRPVARANINLEEISTIQLPIPPLEKQNEIAKHIKQIREQAKQLKAEATKILEQAKQEVEKIILGE